jgi:hypothetical protein
VRGGEPGERRGGRRERGEAGRDLVEAQRRGGARGGGELRGGGVERRPPA